MTLASYHVPFWPSLWPSLVATIVGVAIGLPLALWLHRWATRQGRRSEDADRRASLRRAAVALRESVTWNGVKADSLANSIRNDDYPFDAPLETARWRAVQDEFVRTAHDPELQGRVAFFFDNVRRSAHMIDRRFEFQFGIAAATTHAAEVNEALTGQLLQDLPAISLEALELDTILKSL